MSRWVVIFACGCGRIAFDPLGTGTGAGDGGNDAFIAACGDNICTAGAGETCHTCADCNTRAFVCGNLLCDPGEDGTTCAVDCGPSLPPSAWITNEDDFLTMLNAARTSGRDCPGMTNNAVAAFASSSALQDLSRVWAQVGVIENGPGVPCNGGDFLTIASDRSEPVNGALGFYGPAPFSMTTAMNTLFNDNVRCPFAMDPTYTEVGVGYREQPGGIGYVAFYFR